MNVLRGVTRVVSPPRGPLYLSPVCVGVHMCQYVCVCVCMRMYVCPYVDCPGDPSLTT